MRFKFAVLLSALALSGVGVAAAQTDVPTDPTPATCDERSAATHIKQAQRTIKAGWARKHWRSGPKKSQGRAVKEHLRCLERGKDDKKVKTYLAEKKSALSMYRNYRRVTPYRCQSGLYGTWAIPCYIIACESGFSWSAYNPSGARGAYQFLGWPVPWPVNSFRDKVAHHRQAAALSLSNWVCA